MRSSVRLPPRLPLVRRGLAWQAQPRHVRESSRRLLCPDARAGSEPNSTDGGLAACGHSPPPSVEETSRAKDILSQMQFVGLTEKWDLTVCLWHARFGPPSCDPSEFVDTRPGEMAAENTWYGTKPFEQTGFRDEHDGALYKHAENLFWGALHRLNLTRDQCDDWKRSCIAWSSVHGVG